MSREKLANRARDFLRFSLKVYETRVGPLKVKTRNLFFGRRRNWIQFQGSGAYAISGAANILFTSPNWQVPSELPECEPQLGFKLQLLNDKEPTKQYAVIFYQGDEAFSGLPEFAQKYHVTSAHFTAIGAVNGATLGWFDPQRKMYKKIPVNGQHEVIGMSGDIAPYQGKPVVHTHMMVGAPDGTTRAGPVLAAYVSPDAI
jgi:uncharacterized protein